MTIWRSAAAAVDDTTAVLDSCSLKHRRRVYFTVYARRPVGQGREEGAQNESTYVSKWFAVNSGEVGDEGREESRGC
jgi:hypothetical protein